MIKKYIFPKKHFSYRIKKELKKKENNSDIEITKIRGNKYVVSSLKDHSIYFFELSEKKEIINLKRVDVFERVRDLKFKDDKLYLFLEETPSIGVINLEN